MAITFPGGIHPDDKKRETRQKTIEILPPPAEIILPVSMHIGAPCMPLVVKGERVKMGQVIADSTAPVSAPIHASVSGRVTAIEPREHPNGSLVNSIVIENDFEDEQHESVVPAGNLDHLGPDQIIRHVRAAGIVGPGGAAFPTHFKIKSGLGKVERLFINACECEPYLTSDHRVLLEMPEQVVSGAIVLMRAFGLKDATIVVESNKEDVIRMLRESLGKIEGITVKVVKTKYPQGGEKQLIRTCTGLEVPPGGLPADVGCAVFSTGTAAAIYRAIATGMPLIRRIVTVSGSAVANPKNLNVRLGTPVKAVIDAAGGFREEPWKLLTGGPMMGVAQYSPEIPIIKSTNGVMAFSEREDRLVDHPACIRCGRCVSVCPMRLTPVFMHMYGQKGRLSECEGLNVKDCIECGSCTYVCPARIPLVSSFRMIKTRL